MYKKYTKLSQNMMYISDTDTRVKNNIGKKSKKKPKSKKKLIKEIRKLINALFKWWWVILPMFL